MVKLVVAVNIGRDFLQCSTAKLTDKPKNDKDRTGDY